MTEPSRAKPGTRTRGDPSAFCNRKGQQAIKKIGEAESQNCTVQLLLWETGERDLLRGVGVEWRGGGGEGRGGGVDVSSIRKMVQAKSRVQGCVAHAHKGHGTCDMRRAVLRLAIADANAIDGSHAVRQAWIVASCKRKPWLWAVFVR
jgi:hypothetical protein